MNQLIKVNQDSDKQTVSARDLWEFLERPHSEFLKWFARYSEYGFIENVDYRAYRQISRHANGRDYEETDYEITVEMGKELAMLQKTEKGKQARQYFIELEKKWNSPEVIMARALQMAHKQINTYKNQLEEVKPLVSFAETCLASKDSILIRELAKIASKQNIVIGEKRLYKKLRQWNLIMSNSTEPYQTAIDSGWFEVVQGGKETSYGNLLYKTTRVTPKGQVYIIERLKKEIC